MTDRMDGVGQVVCPRWCRRPHVGAPTRVAHQVTLTDAQLNDLTVTVVVAHSERLGGPTGIGPHARIEITGRGGDAAGIDLTPREVTMLAGALCVDGGAEVIARALRAASAALNEATTEDTTEEITGVAAGEAAAPVGEVKAQGHDDGSPRR